jgi:hypothetical protein
LGNLLRVLRTRHSKLAGNAPVAKRPAMARQEIVHPLRYTGHVVSVLRPKHRIRWLGANPSIFKHEQDRFVQSLLLKMFRNEGASLTPAQVAMNA